MLYTEGNRISVNEVYMGRTPEIQKLFSDFCEVRDKALRRKSIPSATDISKVENGIAKVFGFSSVYITFEISNTINAYTYPIASSLAVDTSKIIHTTKTGGYTFDKSAKIVLYMVLTTGLFLDSRFSNEEVFAIMLHEIGHSFNVRGNHMGDILKIHSVITIVKIIWSSIANLLTSGKIPVGTVHSTAMSQSNSYKSVIINISKALRTNPIVKAIVGGTALVQYIINLAIEPILYVASRTTLIQSAIPMKLGSIIMNGILKLIGGNPFTSIEYLPDDFATTYGFGAAMDSAVRKLGNWDFINEKKLRSKIPGIRQLNKLLDTILLEYSQCFDIHPSSEKRSYQIRKTLLAELDKNKDLDPRLKRDIKEQINQICKECDELDKSAKVILENKEDAIILMREILKETGGDYEAGDLVDKYIGMEGIDKDFENRLID